MAEVRGFGNFYFSITLVDARKKARSIPAVAVMVSVVVVSIGVAIGPTNDDYSTMVGGSSMNTATGTTYQRNCFNV